MAEKPIENKNEAQEEQKVPPSKHKGCLSKILKTLLVFAVLVVVLLIIAFIWVQFRMIGPHQDYELDLVTPADSAPPAMLQVGVAKCDITVNMDDYDTWVDVNENTKYDEGIDTYTDRNGNGRFDGVWIAGFNVNRPAKGVHDPQWVRAIAFRNNGVTLVMVTIDAIGIFHNEFVTIRKKVNQQLGIDHVMFSSTHCHEVPDTMKIWSYWKRLPFKAKGKPLDIPLFGEDKKYMSQLQDKALEAIEEAVKNLKPAEMYYTKVKVPKEGFIRDSRQPEIFNPYMYLMRFTPPGKADETVATFVNWGNHPEALGGDNSFISSDFVHYLRKGLEEGVSEPNGVKGFGGMCLFFQGEIGGLINPLRISIPHRDGKRSFKESSFEKTEALGDNLAILAANALRSKDVKKNETPLLAVVAKTLLVKMENHYKYAIMLGLLHEGYYSGGKAKTEINVIRLGDICILAVPGEIYPEIVEGGVEAKDGNDFGLTAPLETPPLRNFMKGDMNFIIGLANDEIGYMIPKSQWDTKAPFIYRKTPDRPQGKAQYGEQNSGGSDVAGTIYEGAKELLEKMNKTHPFTK